MFTIYHLPQLKKIGCTSRFDERMKEQDIDPPFDQYIKFKTNDMEEASFVEEELRKFYKYKPDSPMSYIEKYGSHSRDGVIKKISNTPSVGWNELYVGASKDALRDDMNKYKSVILGASGEQYTFGPEKYELLIKKAKASQYKDFYWQITTLKKIHAEKIEEVQSGCDTDGACCHNNCIPEFQQIRDWATDKGIFSKGDAKTQYLKLQEEAGEVARAILKNDEPEIIDGLGDVLVVLINLSHLCGYRLEDCLAEAYEVISKRKGKMVNGTFVKDGN